MTMISQPNAIRKVIWVNLIFFTVTTLTALIGCPLYLYHYGLSMPELALFIFYVVATGMSITVGYHRLFCHSTFHANTLMQFLFLLDTIPRTFATYFTPKEAAGEKNKKIKVFSILIAILITIISVIAVPYGVMEFLPKYEESIVPMQILSLALIPLSISGIQQAEFFGQEKSRPVLLGGIMEASLYITSIVVLGQLYGLIGMATSFLIAVWIRVSFNFFFSKKFAYN